ncbi:MAG: molybdenum cofactor biosynthesis protein MoaB [Rhodothermales bacterium]|nr:molybdenum cofactor biosynthesis protein MoaB [Rhodothermales bacterium]
MSTVPEAHRAEAGRTPLSCAVLTCSDTRTTESDTSGQLMCSMLEAAGHRVTVYDIVREGPGAVSEALSGVALECDAILLNGGTGIAPRDGTIEAVDQFVQRSLPGFGELFRMLSWQEIGAAAMLSRATAGTRGRTVVFATPGSTAAVRLAMEKLIIPDLRHIHGQLNR